VGQAKRKPHRNARARRAAQTDERATLDDTAVDKILELRLGTEDGDPVAGIRNALVASAVIWVALGAAVFYF
jgi:hypothetical protein